MSKLLLYFFTIQALFSCISQKKSVYIQNADLQPGINIPHKLTQYRLQPGDLLSIRVHSLEPAISHFFNIESANAVVPNSPASLYINGYSISDSGYVKIPMIDKVKVVNLTLIEAQDVIQKALDVPLKNSTVLIKLISNKISVVGEVARPGFFYFYNDKVNVLEVLSLAGDILPTGNRSNVKVIRQENGQSRVFLLDMTDSRIISSEAYFIMPNDVVYVEPLKAKAVRNNLAPLTVVFAGISAFILLLNFVVNASK